MSDGDSLVVLDEARQQHRIRLAGIDAPERRQPYGERARQNLAALAQGKNVLVVSHKRDRYRRLVARVFAAECPRPDCLHTLDLGLEQLRAGLAWHYRRYADEQAPEERARYATVEGQARLRRAGLWQESDPLAPWDFRDGQRLEPRAGVTGVGLAGTPARQLPPNFPDR